MSDADREANRIREELLADLQNHTLGEILPVGENLDAVREAAEEILGQPCIARTSDDGQSIIVQTPVIKP